MSIASADLQSFVDEVRSTLGARLAAIYRFGSDYARGPRGHATSVLILVDRIDRELLVRAGKLGDLARAADIGIRVDTAQDILGSADCLPIFTLRVIDTKELVAGDDVLAGLEVHPQHLRLSLEHSLRGLHRDLLRSYIDAPGDLRLAGELRGCARKLIYLLEAVLIVADQELPRPPSPTAIVDTVSQSLLPAPDRAIWNRLRRFAGFEDVLAHDELVSLYADVLGALSSVIEVVDKLPPSGSSGP